MVHLVRQEERLMCCDKPCLVPTWEGGQYGLKCTNCQTFTKT